MTTIAPTQEPLSPHLSGNADVPPTNETDAGDRIDAKVDPGKSISVAVDNDLSPDPSIPSPAEPLVATLVMPASGGSNPTAASPTADFGAEWNVPADEGEQVGNRFPKPISAHPAEPAPEFVNPAVRDQSDSPGVTELESPPKLGVESAPPDLAEANPPSDAASDTSPTPGVVEAHSDGLPTAGDSGQGHAEWADGAANTPPGLELPGALETEPTGEEPIRATGGDIAAPRGASKYRPQLKERQADASQRSRPAVTAPVQFAGGSLEADLRLVFQPGDWGVELSILLSRPESSPDEVDVQLGLETLQLSALDDGLFEPVPLSGAETALSDGIAAESLEVPRRRWVRTGRQLHVFSERTGVYGFVSVPRVLIGLENVILCAASVADRVLAYCEAAGSTPPAEVHGPGVPENWRCFRGFWPQWPGEWIDDEIFLALSPLPHAAIEFTGGIALARMGWLAGRPPSIRILGGNPSAGAVTIDGKPAERDSADRWTASGWDAVGNHAVRYAGLSRRYEIADPEGEWPSWPAHSGRGVSVSGALAADAAGHPQVVLSGAATWVLGSRPGEVTWAPALPGGFAAACTPSFRPVWAVAAKVGRHRPVPRLLDSLEPPGSAIRAPRETVLLWCELIRGAAREKKATTHGEGSALWQSYVETARLVRRRVR
ncbi:hypothetical protein [Mesorhizobium sp.]|uniref:hypothetical protein n=1 Tax=Mesorhizobium sp. TaxID=1871066 RepID=UPI000FE81B7D|nr:hypothetical protein [Mesorhizobium sp.]RWP67754.1 MAG: hypothetical protein EOR09_32010 [Mesorhizobium sp.]